MSSLPEPQEYPIVQETMLLPVRETSETYYGPYRLLKKLGAGGMGEIYLAEDTRLDRRVALKMLLEEFTQDADRLRRFVLEAKAASALNHPNIITIFDIGEANGKHYMATEYIQGQTLRQQMATPLTIPVVLDLAIQIADALKAAHETGVVHRDIKPENVMLRPDGLVKVLDFGIAKLIERTSPARADQSDKQELALDEYATRHNPELALPKSAGEGTAPGIILGTVTYMSPEQLRGEKIDARTDIFSLGVMLYEVITGTPPFTGETQADKIAAILKQEPEPLAAYRPDAPPELDPLISKALRKDPGLRYQEIKELLDDLKVLKEDWEFKSKLERSGQVQASPQQEVTKVPRVQRRLAARAVAVAVVALLSAAGLYWFLHRAVTLTGKDTVVLADFLNSTGDAVFDDALKQGLAANLEQSPFLNILTDRTVRDTLKLMGRAPDERLTAELALEVGLRSGSKAVIAGSISSLGSQYVLGLSALGCQSGESLARQQVQADRKEDVLGALNQAATKLREQVGESLATIKQYDTPIIEATTASLEALKAYSLGRKTRFLKGDIAAIPLFEQAIALDPNFASAYLSLGASALYVGRYTRARECIQKAYDLRDRVGEREKLNIAARFYHINTGELEKAIQAYGQWVQSYPQDSLPYGGRALCYAYLGQYEKAAAEEAESIRLNPEDNLGLIHLSRYYRLLNRLKESKTTYQEALSQHVDHQVLHISLYGVAFIENDAAEMERQVAWAAGKPGIEDILFAQQSLTEAYQGHLEKARDLSRRAVEAGVRSDDKERAGQRQAHAALREAEFGNTAQARQEAASALALSPTASVRILTALAFARAEEIGRAQTLANALEKEYPVDTMLVGYWLPTIRAAIEIGRKDLAKAIDILKTAAPFELGQPIPMLEAGATMYPVYVRGQAYLILRQGKEAAAEFQKFLDHRGIVINYPLGALAQLGLARAYRLQGDTAKARAAYKDFLLLWKDADPDIPILKQARAEYAQLDQGA
jgi:eukaryotic-like serine/threonine-protein kinase